MRNFQKLGEGLDVKPLLHSVQRQSELWNTERLRTTHEHTPHAEVDDILVRFQDLEKFRATQDAALVLDEHESIWWPAAYKLPEVRALIFPLMHIVQAERLGRVLITRLAPGKQIYPHPDSGAHAAYYERYHIPLQSFPGSLFHCGAEPGTETVHMTPGSCWWVNNAIVHSVVNNSADDRIHLIIDLRVTR